MLFIKKVANALLAGLYFFAVGLLVIVSFSYVLAKIKGLHYNFHDALIQGLHAGLYLGAVIAVLTFLGTSSRSSPP